MDKWTRRFLDMAELVASWSKDPSSGVGCVIAKDKKIISLGYNGFAAGVKDSQYRLDNRDIKYLLTIHSEVNAILTAKQDLQGCTLYCTHPPCSRCASVIAQSGIKKVACKKPDDDFMERWADDLHLSLNVYNEVGIHFETV